MSCVICGQGLRWKKDKCLYGNCQRVSCRSNVVYLVFYFVTFLEKEVAVCLAGGQGSAAMPYRPILSHFKYCLLYTIITRVVDLCRKSVGPAAVSDAAKRVFNDGSAVKKQVASVLSREQDKPSSRNKTGTPGRLNKSATLDSSKKQGLRSRTRSLDHVKTSSMKDASTKGLPSNVKSGGAKVGRSRSQSVEREETHKLSLANKSRTHMKLTIPRTPQLLK